MSQLNHFPGSVPLSRPKDAPEGDELYEVAFLRSYLEKPGDPPFIETDQIAAMSAREAEQILRERSDSNVARAIRGYLGDLMGDAVASDKICYEASLREEAESNG